MTKNGFDSIYQKIISKLEENLPEWLYYHNANHTKYVVEKAEKLAMAEDVKNRDMELIKFAALYHDIGFLIGQKNHEKKGCEIASQDLNGTLLSNAEFDKVCGMINATKIPQSPQNILEKIVADADLFYLGTSKYKEFSQKLFMELKHFDPSTDEKRWLKIQIDFLSSHNYHTQYGQEFLEPIKQKHLNALTSN